MVTRRYILLLLSLLYVSASDNVYTDSDDPHPKEVRLISNEKTKNSATPEVRFRIEPSSDSLMRNRDSSLNLNIRNPREMELLDKQSHYFPNGNVKRGLYAVSRSFQETEPLLSRQRRSAYGLWQRYLPNTQKNEAKTDEVVSGKNDLIRNPTVQRILYKLMKNGRHSDSIPPRYSGKKDVGKDTGDGIYHRDERMSPILHVPFGKREFHTMDENDTPLKRDMSAAYGNFGGPFGKRNSADKFGPDDSNILASSGHNLSKCVYLEKLGFRMDDCDQAS